MSRPNENGIPFSSKDPRYKRVYYLMNNRSLSLEEALLSIDKPVKRGRKPKPKKEKTSTREPEPEKLIQAIGRLETQIAGLAKSVEGINKDHDPYGIPGMILDNTCIIHKDLLYLIKILEKR